MQNFGGGQLATRGYYIWLINNFSKKIKKTLCLTGVFFLFLPKIVSSEVRTSETYRIFADTLSSGGAYSTSTNFRVWDAIGEIGSEESSTSTNFRARIGFAALNLDDVLTVTFNKSVINLGVLSPSGASQESLDISYTTNANGFTTTISEDGNLRHSSGADIDDVADGSVTAGSEEYGIRTSGSIGQQNNADTSITTSAKTIASRNDVTPSSSVTVLFRAAVSQSTPEGSYGQTVTITTTGNF